MCIVIVCCPLYDNINSEVTHSVNKYITKNYEQKCKYLKYEKNFSPFLKDFQLPKTVSDLRVILYIYHET